MWYESFARWKYRFDYGIKIALNSVLFHDIPS